MNRADKAFSEHHSVRILISCTDAIVKIY